MAEAKGKRRNRFEHVCRNGHVRTQENTHYHANGNRQCKDCPGFKINREISSSQRAELRRQRGSGEAPIYDQPKSPEYLAYLRSLIPCVSCGAPFGTTHKVGCRVPLNREAAA